MAKKNVPNRLTDTGGDILTKEDLREPRRYAIILHNDDFTTQEFVIHVLMYFLHKNAEDAHSLMLKVHLEGKARVGSYLKDVAETKVEQIKSYSRQHGMPLRVSIEQA